MKVTAIMATCGRHYCSERSLTLFLNQDYNNKQLLIFQNSDIYQELDANINSDLVKIVNNHIDYKTKQPYMSLGAIYNDALTHISPDTDLLTFWDDDDIFLKTHISEGVKGFLRGKKKAYKPLWSLFRDHSGVTKAQNTFEPSIFVQASHIAEYGFSNTTTDQHWQWLRPLISNDQIYIDENGIPTLIYNWGDKFYSYKTSANVGKHNHFDEFRFCSDDHGDKIISQIRLPQNIQKLIS